MTPVIFRKLGIPRAEPFRARSIGLWLVGHHPILSEGGYSPGLGLNATCTLLCPRSTGLAPRLPYGTLLISSLVSHHCKRKKRVSMKGFLYRLRYWIGGYSLRGFIYVVPWFPRRLLLRFSLLEAKRYILAGGRFVSLLSFQRSKP